VRRPGLALLVLLLVPGSAKADIAPDPGFVQVRRVVRLEVARDFGVSFVALSSYGRGVAVVTSGEVCPALTAPVGPPPELWAVRGPLPEDLSRVERAWLEAHGVRAPDYFPGRATAREEEGLERIIDTYRVVDVDSRRITLEHVGETRVLQGGAVASGAAQVDAARPPPWTLASLAVAGLALALLVWRARARRPERA